jgi:hypothetical protein
VIPLKACYLAGLLFSGVDPLVASPADDASESGLQSTLQFHNRRAVVTLYLEDDRPQGRSDAWCTPDGEVLLVSPTGGIQTFDVVPVAGRTWLVEPDWRHEFCNNLADPNLALPVRRWFFSSEAQVTDERPAWLEECTHRQEPWQVKSLRPRYVAIGPGVEVTFLADSPEDLLVGKRGRVCVGTVRLGDTYRILGARRDEQTGQMLGVAEIAGEELLDVSPADIRLMWGPGDSCDPK